MDHTKCIKIEDRLNAEYKKMLEENTEIKYEPCERCGNTGPHFCIGEKETKHFSIEEINEEDLPIGNYQIGLKI